MLQQKKDFELQKRSAKQNNRNMSHRPRLNFHLQSSLDAIDLESNYPFEFIYFTISLASVVIYYILNWCSINTRPCWGKTGRWVIF